MRAFLKYNLSFYHCLRCAAEKMLATVMNRFAELDVNLNTLINLIL